MSKLTSIEKNLNPFRVYRELRQEQPVYYDPQRKNWNIFRYDDVQRTLSSYDTFSSNFSQDEIGSASSPFAAAIISTDPPRHRQLRSLVSMAFTPKAVEDLAPRISEIVNEYLDAAPKGEMDLLHHLGTPLPVTVIAELLGIPVEDRQRFKHWSDAAVSIANFGQDIEIDKYMGDPAILEMGAYFMQMIEKRRADPGNDLISGLIKAEIDGQRLDLMELLGFCVLLLVAGNETTTNLLGNAMLTFTERPEDWEKLRNSPDLVPQAIEEVLRFRSPVQCMFRIARQDVKMGGVTIPAGDPVVAWIGSANHDENQFPDPECFDIQRSPNRHLAFGQGIHYCLGAPLARLEAKIALQALLDRYKKVERLPAALERIPSVLIFGLKNLPIKVQ